MSANFTGPSNTADIDEAIALAKLLMSAPILSKDAEGEPLTEASIDEIAKALQEASTNPDSNDFDVLTMIAADLLYQNQRMPEWLATFAADVLSGKRRRPTKRGADRYGNWERDYKFWKATQEVANSFGLQRYSNNELSVQTTAAEVVSQAAGCRTDIVITAFKKFSRIMGEK